MALGEWGIKYSAYISGSVGFFTRILHCWFRADVTQMAHTDVTQIVSQVLSIIFH